MFGVLVSREATLAERIEHYSIPEPNTGCSLWLGTVNPKGYGRMWWQGRMQQSHRLAWMAEYGDVPDGLFVLHRCDFPPCCNPSHLFLGTIAENNADMIAKGRHRSPSGPKKKARYVRGVS